MGDGVSLPMLWHDVEYDTDAEDQPRKGERVKDYWTQIFAADQKIDGAHGWIQWKGTDVCMDIHCTCGAHHHHDGDFFYHFECPDCKRVFAVGQNVKLIELNPEQAAHAKASECFQEISSPSGDHE